MSKKITTETRYFGSVTSKVARYRVVEQAPCRNCGRFVQDERGLRWVVPCGRLTITLDDGSVLTHVSPESVRPVKIAKPEPRPTDEWVALLKETV